MIGFAPPENDSYDSSEPNKKPGEKEVPTVAPGREIGEPNPSVVPSPGPDRYINSPAPEITPIPPDNPIPTTPPEIIPVSATEMFNHYL